MFKLGEKVHVVLDGKITEIRMIGDKVKFTVTNDNHAQAFVYEEDLVKRDFLKKKGKK